jgi:hypothetical protein
MNTSKVSKKIKFKCEYCSRSFQQFLKLSEHTNICEFGKRIKIMDTEEGRIGHRLWRISFKGTNRKKFDYKEFTTHRDFKFFIELGTFCTKINALDSEKYMDWCIKERIKQKLWTSETNYEKFIKHYLTHEDPVEAVIRSINYIKSLNITNYFNTVQPGTFINAIEFGRISPWLYLLYWNANVIFKRMNEDHNKRFNTVMDPSVWSMLQRRHKNICEEIKKTLKKEML